MERINDLNDTRINLWLSTCATLWYLQCMGNGDTTVLYKGIEIDNLSSLPHRGHSVYGFSQWEMTLQCNIVSYWLSPYTEWSLPHILYRSTLGPEQKNAGHFEIYLHQWSLNFSWNFNEINVETGLNELNDHHTFFTNWFLWNNLLILVLYDLSYVVYNIL